MSYVPTPEEALDILKKYNKEEFHIHHGQVVGGVMEYFARQHDPERCDFWKSVGILHDLDFEMYPEEHCKKEQEMMRQMDLDEDLIHACVSHGYGLVSDVKPELMMEKILFATDELTGLIGAAALMRPSKSVMDMEVKSIKKKFKDKRFAAGCSREIIQKGADMLGWDLSELFEKTLEAMRSCEAEIKEEMENM